MAEKKEETPEEKRRMLDFAHECAQIASAETIARVCTNRISRNHRRHDIHRPYFVGRRPINKTKNPQGLNTKKAEKFFRLFFLN